MRKKRWRTNTCQPDQTWVRCCCGFFFYCWRQRSVYESRLSSYLFKEIAHCLISQKKEGQSQVKLNSNIHYNLSFVLLFSRTSSLLNYVWKDLFPENCYLFDFDFFFLLLSSSCRSPRSPFILLFDFFSKATKWKDFIKQTSDFF